MFMKMLVIQSLRKGETGMLPYLGVRKVVFCESVCLCVIVCVCVCMCVCTHATCCEIVDEQIIHMSTIFQVSDPASPLHGIEPEIHLSSHF